MVVVLSKFGLRVLRVDGVWMWMWVEPGGSRKERC